MSSYGHAYLTSYGWSGAGTGLRKGAIAKPLAILPKKNLGGIGKDRDEAFPFWDHLFTAASKAITIRISSDDQDVEDQSPACIDDALRRTATGIISNRRPISGVPASTSPSGSSTPTTDAHLRNSAAAADRPPSLLTTAKREAAKRSLYAMFFRGPVLGPNDDPPDIRAVPSESSSPSSTPVREPIGKQANIATESEKRKSCDVGAETREECRERKRLKKEREATRAARRAKKSLGRGKKKKQRVIERKDETQCEENEASSPRMTERRARKSLAGHGPEPAESAGKKLEKGLVQDAPLSHAEVIDALSVVLTTKMERANPTLVLH